MFTEFGCSRFNFGLEFERCISKAGLSIYLDACRHLARNFNVLQVSSRYRPPVYPLRWRTMSPSLGDHQRHD